MAVELAVGDPQPAWPLPGVGHRTPAGRAFGASRGAKKWHAGIDLVAPEGWLVLAMEPGRIVTIRRGWSNVYDKRTGELVAGNTARVLVEGDSGLVVNYAALGIDSWDEFGHRKGDRVGKGEPIGRVGRYPHGGQMLHLETYRQGTRDNVRWYKGQPPPPELLDPTDYVERAAEGGAAIEMPPIDVRPFPGPPPPAPKPTPAPARAGGGGLLLIAALAAVALAR